MPPGECPAKSVSFELPAGSAPPRKGPGLSPVRTTESLAADHLPSRRTRESASHGNTLVPSKVQESPIHRPQGVGPSSLRRNKSSAAAARNSNRVREALDQDTAHLGKNNLCLPSSPDDFPPVLVEGPGDEFIPPESTLATFKSVAASPAPPPDPPPVKFGTSPGEVQHNTTLSQSFDWDLDKLIAAHQNTTLGHGQEFRPLPQLTQVLGNHPNFPLLSEVLNHGMHCQVSRPLSETERRAELSEVLSRGNHKSATDNPKEAAECLERDITHGFSLAVSEAAVQGIKGAMVQPCGTVNQKCLNPDGSIVKKMHLAQDFSFALTAEDASVNKRIEIEKCPEMTHGWCLSRCIHFTVALRLDNPSVPIHTSKCDCSDAHRRLAHSAAAAAQSIIVFAGLAYIALRLTFGGSPNPPSWCAFSEMVMDLANEIPLIPDWDPATLRSPIKPQPFEPEPLYVHKEPFGQAKPSAVKTPTSVSHRADCFIDDIVQIFLSSTRNLARIPFAVPLAVHLTSRLHAGDQEPITRRLLFSINKLLAEGTPSESQTVLGWKLDTRQLITALPNDKCLAWSSEIQLIVERGSATYEELESCVGRLNHAGAVIPLSRHFLSRIRNCLQPRRHKRQRLPLSQPEVLDLTLWQTFLAAAKAGMSLNRLTIRQPTKVAFSDSCPFGMGGWDPSGRAWRLPTSSESPLFGDDSANDLLEFLAAAVAILLNSDNASNSHCILAVSDSTTGIGWLHRSSRVRPDSAHFEAAHFVARCLATKITLSPHCLASQHLKGEHNVVADWLSFAGSQRGCRHPLACDFPSDRILTERFHHSCPQLIPQNFEISPTPNEILSFITQALHLAESSWIRRANKRMKPTRGPGAAGRPSASTQESPPIATLKLSTQDRKSSSSELSSACAETPNGTPQGVFLESVRSRWCRALSEMPQAKWLRRFGTVTNQAPFTSRTEGTSFHPSKTSSERSPMQTPQRITKKR